MKPFNMGVVGMTPLAYHSAKHTRAWGRQRYPLPR